ncbi:S1C family serine protease [Bacillus salitolerans]|uniref:S1C family serine protease n=1 Tax=Bacillus salitolerans TaxID=1437434 RepID=A0ABW4LSF2_9BACI
MENDRQNLYDEPVYEHKIELNQERYSSNQHNQKVSKGMKVKGFLQLVAAGVIGSVLTLTIAPYTDLDDQASNQTISKNEQLSTSSEMYSTANSNGASTPTFSQTSNGSIADTIEIASKAIVGVVNYQQQQNPFSTETAKVESGTGSGVIFKKDDSFAYIITNHHVIEGAENLEVSLYNGTKVEAQLIGSDALTDLAVLKIDSSKAEHALTLGDSSTLRPGDTVLAIGNPLGLDLSRTVTQGIVSATDRTISIPTSAGEWDLQVIQTDAAINPGNSGGALINTNGELVGINSLKISQNGVEGLGFAIPSNDVLPIVNEILENGKIERPYMGVGLASLEEIPPIYLQGLPDHITKGVVVTSVDPNSAAGKAGIQVQDIITAINDTDIHHSNDLRKLLYKEMEIGQEIEVHLYRQGERNTITLTLTSNQTN